MTIHQLEYLMQQYANRTLNGLERQELMQWLESEDNISDEALNALLEQYLPSGEVEMPEDWRQAVDHIVATDRLPLAVPLQSPVTRPAGRLYKMIRYGAAAAILLLTAGAVYYFTSRPADPAPAVATTRQPAANDALPGSDGAVLTLADGSKIVLDSLGNGTVASQQGATVVLDNGKLQYNPEKATVTDIVYNTMTTPRGRQFRLTLPDGSRVWMNAASSLRFPTQFSLHERRVELGGEAYFQVAASREKPFIVQLPDNNTIEVTGTHFNVKAYSDETDTRTTLLEGIVTIKTNEKERTMKPGQQTRITAGGAITLVPGANTQQAIAWMSRSFSFDKDDMETVLRQLARWYDIEVKYLGAIPKTPITSNISMDNNLSDILAVLKQSGLKCSLENGVLYVR